MKKVILALFAIILTGNVVFAQTTEKSSVLFFNLVGFFVSPKMHGKAERPK